ncbi:MAG: hypothetical protein AAF492_26875, partial [Verrucomicrobiota bacterium]
ALNPPRSRWARTVRALLWNRLSLGLMAIIPVMGLAEWWARATYVHGRQSVYERADRLLDPYPWKEQFLRDRKGMFGHLGSTYHDYYIAGPRPLESETVNYRGDYYGAHACPDSAQPAPGNRRIWFFGGSTMENLTTTDEGTLANQAVKVLNENGVPAEGHNFGFRSFHSTLESIKFQDLLRREPPARHPAVAVFYDGYNDAWHSWQEGSGNIMRSFTHPIRIAVERRHGELIRYALSSWLSERSKFCARFVEPKLRPWPEKIKPLKPTEENVARAVEVYLRNTRMLEAICDEFGITPLFVLQPLIITKQGRSPEEETALGEERRGRPPFIEAFYRRTREAMKTRKTFVDFSSVLDHNRQWDFYDMGHTGPETSVTLGRAMGQTILERLDEP